MFSHVASTRVTYSARIMDVIEQPLQHFNEAFTNTKTRKLRKPSRVWSAVKRAISLESDNRQTTPRRLKRRSAVAARANNEACSRVDFLYFSVTDRWMK